MEAKSPEDPVFVAAYDFIARTGAKSIQLRYEDDNEPTIWNVYIDYGYGHAVGAGLDPMRALKKVMDEIVDGGACAHCGRVTALADDWEADQLADEAICWIVYDPELQKFRRSCEGETKGRVFTRDPETGKLVGRNDPCPCGSGKKFKRCHGA
jgi:hypothetical protein